MNLKQITLLLVVAACRKEAPAPSDRLVVRSQKMTPPGQLNTAPGVDIFLDGKKLRTFQISELQGDGRTLRSLVDGPVAGVLVHGDHELTVQPDKLDELAVRLNRRGDLIKVGPRDGSSGGIRAVTRIEFRSR